MSTKKILTIDEIKTNLHKINFTYIDNSFNSQNYLLSCTCPNNHNIIVNYYDILKNKNKCNLCPKLNYSVEKISIDSIKNIFQNLNFTLLSTKYIGYDVPLNYICPNNHTVSMSYHKWKSSIHKCNECSKLSLKKRFSLSYDFVKKIFEDRNYKLLSTNYNNKKEKLNFICPNNHEGSISFDSFHYAKSECAKCTNSKKYTIDEIKSILAKDNYTLLSTNYINNKEKLYMLCSKKHNIDMRLNDFISGYRCKVCIESQGERKITNFLDNNNNVKYYDTEYKFNNCSNFKPLPFDFYVNDLFLIEYDGEQHFREVEFFGGKEGLILRQKNDKIKTDYCKKNQIPLLRISYNHINNIPEIINKFMDDLVQNKNLIYFSDKELYNYLN